MKKTLTDFINADLAHHFHPCAQMKDYEIFPPIIIQNAQGSYIETRDGKKIIDSIASWWCKSLGHQHPRLKKAIENQLQQFEHVMFAHTTHDNIIQLSKKLATLTPSLSKIYYAGDGSCAVEIALKMSLHAQQLLGNKKRTKFIALKNGYHGETTGALSVSDLGIYKDPYAALLFDTHFIEPLPYLNDITDPLWQHCDTHWEKILENLTQYENTAAAIILEPILQGAAGMKIYSPALLKHLRTWTKENNIYLIADEIMTGMGRTGKMLAVDHAAIEPDFLCLSKGLSGGFLPFSTVLTRPDITDLFYDDYTKGKSFLHSQTYCGNPLGVALALEMFQIFSDENICTHVHTLGNAMHLAMQDIADETRKLENVRNLGAIAAAEIKNDNPHRRIGFEVYKAAMEKGALIRPIGNTLYWLPPLNMSLATLAELKTITMEVIKGI